MKKQLTQLLEFHKAYESFYSNELLSGIPDRELQLRENLMREELKELMEAMRSEPIENIAKELADLLYVTFGTAVAYGLQDKLEAVFDEVHASNMSKLGEDGKPIRREDGKALKGPNYRKADVKKVLNTKQ